MQLQIDIETELAAVVFDEVHYINDEERGQTWEKTILMLPEHIQMIMLSATIDSPERFAKWAERTGTTKQVYLASTDKRVVPLSHYGFLTTTESFIKGLKDKVLEKEIRDGTNRLVLLRDDRGVFQEGGYRDLAKVSKTFLQKQAPPQKRKHVLNSLALFLRDREMLPAIAFVFSRRLVEACAADITVPLLEDDSKVPYTVAHECEQIVRKLPNWHEYMVLPEYQTLVSLLEKGIGIHHSGMIPILREIVELMISRKVIKLLFATESFAIGLDCPIKTAIFTGIQKFDGRQERYLLSHEYTQMAGRAGRRGIDTVGHVVHCNNLFDLPAMSEYKAILGGRPQSLISKFRISYSLLLRTLTADDESTKDGVVDPLDCVRTIVAKSMMSGELQDAVAIQESVVDALEKQVALKRVEIDQLKTPETECRAYLKAEEGAAHSVNKKRKDHERTMAHIRDSYKTWQQDVAKVRENDYLVKQLDQERAQHDFLKQYSETQIQHALEVLKEGQFLAEDYTLTYLGKVAAQMAEVHPLVLARFMVDGSFFQEYSAVQIVGLLSCFIDVKVAEEHRRAIPHCEDAFVQRRMVELAAAFSAYDAMESDRGMRTGICYDDVLQYDLADDVMEWCNCEDEAACRRFLQERLSEKGVSTGDFTKGLLKICTILQEWEPICESLGEMDLLHKVKSIPGMVLKYVATAQSLYV